MQRLGAGAEMAVYAQEYWQERFAADRKKLEQRRQQGLQQARSIASACRSRWPTVTAVHCFGSVLGDGFREHSDLDLLIDGLPAD